MKIVQSYLNDIELNFYTLYLSFLYLKKYYNSVTMYCNSKTYNSIIKYIPYDEIIIMENTDGINYKLQIIEDIVEDFIYVDPEIILFENILQKYIDNQNKYDLIVMNTFPKSHFGPEYFVDKNKKILEKNAISTKYDDNFFSTMILGMNMKFKSKYISNVKKIQKLFNNNEIIGNYDFGYYDMVLDELTTYLTYLNNSFTCYEIITIDDIKNLGFNKCVEKNKITILDRDHGNYIDLIKNKILKDFFNDYFIIDKFENKHKIKNITIQTNIKKPNLKYKLSFCVTCMNRNEFIKKTLPYNLNLISKLKHLYNIELVLVNYDSKDDMDEYLQNDFFEEYKKQNIFIYKKVFNKDFFYRTNAKNIAHLNATGDILCGLDADCYLSEDLIYETYNVFLTHGIHNIILHGDYNYNYGYVCLSKNNFKLVDGYDENLVYYGCEDCDLVIRCCEKTKAKIKNLEGKYNHLNILHDDTLRKNTYSNKYISNFINSIIVNYNMKNLITNPNNGIYGQEDLHIKTKELIDYNFVNKYILSDNHTIEMWKNIDNINEDNWLSHELLINIYNFLKENNINNI